MAEPAPRVQHQFDDDVQQHEAAQLGMWVFLATEVMFFGGLFLAYVVYHLRYPSAFALASHHLERELGAWNTAVLLTSSLTMALAVHGAQVNRRRMTVVCLVVTMLLGTAFLGIKGYEYHEKFVNHLVPGRHFIFAGNEARGAEMFFYLYFAMTGLHALHMLAGLGVMFVMTVQAGRGRFDAEYHSPLEMAGLYWHFVDIVWIFLFPLLYLVGGKG